MSIQIKVPKEHLLALIFWPTVSIFEISMSSSEILAKARHIINSKYKKVGACSSLSTTMSKPVNNHVQAGQLNHVQTGQLNHVQACQQPCSSWPAQPCSSLSTTMFKLAPAQPCSSLSTCKTAMRFYVHVYAAHYVYCIL